MSTARPESVSYARRLGLFSGTMSVIGGIIGSGIFLNPAIVAERVGTTGLTLLAWVLGGVVAVLGGFIYAELGCRLPRAGGPYAYLRAGIHPLAGFLYAWALLLIMATGAGAAVSYTFASYAADFFGLDPSFRTPLAIGSIAIFTVINIFGVQAGAWTQNVFVLLKLGALALLIGAGLFLRPADGVLPVACSACAVTPPAGLGGAVLAMATAFVPVLFAYGGWQQTNFIAEEMIEPERNLPRALLAGVAVVVLVYLAVNGAYLRVLGVGGLAASTAPAAETLGAVLGPVGRKLIALGVVISTGGFLNAITLLSPRVYQAMARDGLFFERFARLDPRWRTPVIAIVFQGVWSVVLLSSGTYGHLLDYVVFADWIFFGSTAASLLVLRARARRAGLDAPAFRTPGSPVTELLFIAAAIYVVAGSVASNPGNAARGVLLIAAGVPVFWFRSRRLPTAE